MNRLRPTARSITRRLNRPLGRRLARSSLRRVVARRRGPDELSQALTAFSRALRCQRRLAKLAPRFFDSAVVNQEVLHRAERRRWLARWEPYLNRAYGLDPDTKSSDLADDDLPPLPAPAVQRAVDETYAELQTWMTAGRLALENYRERHPHALPSFSQIARLLRVAMDLGRWACGYDPSQPAPPPAENYDQVWADLERAYPSSRDPGTSSAAPAQEVVNPSAPPPPPPPAASPLPADDKRDLVPHRLVIGAHGLLCLERIKLPEFSGQGGERDGAS